MWLLFSLVQPTMMQTLKGMIFLMQISQNWSEKYDNWIFIVILIWSYHSSNKDNTYFLYSNSCLKKAEYGNFGLFTCTTVHYSNPLIWCYITVIILLL